MMGKHRAEFPQDRQYAKNHMWAQKSDSLVKFGFSAYAVRLLQDVYFLEWNIDAGTSVNNRQTIGAIESSKAESDLYAPVAGELVEFNEQLLDDPSSINVDTYGAGWLFSMRSETTELLSPEQYLEHLDSAWTVAQRTIKGQFN